MSYDEISKLCGYIMTNEPKSTEFETIDAAIRAVMTGCRAAKKGDLVNPDDSWLIPVQERDKFAGIMPLSGRGWFEGFTPNIISVIRKAAAYAMSNNDVNTKNDIYNQVNNELEMVYEQYLEYMNQKDEQFNVKYNHDEDYETIHKR